MAHFDGIFSQLRGEQTMFLTKGMVAIGYLNVSDLSLLPHTKMNTNTIIDLNAKIQNYRFYRKKAEK